MNNFKPEEKVIIEMWDWLKQLKFKGLIEVYFEKNNKVCKNLNGKIFKINGKSRESPDLIICFYNKYQHKQYIVIEVKNANKDRNVHNSFKIFYKYYMNYVQGKTKYSINKKEIKISHFVVATQFSKIAKIFKDDKKIIDNIDKGENDTWREMSFYNKTLPRCEYEKTRSFLRQLWANFKPFREKNKDKPSLGILVSDILTTFHPKDLQIQSGMIGNPMIQVMQWKKWLKKPQWQQNKINLF